MKALIYSLIVASLVSGRALSADVPSLVGTWTGQRDRIAKVEGRRGGLATLVITQQQGNTFVGHLKRSNPTGDEDEQLWGAIAPGDPLDQERTIARAIDAGVNYFDTAVQYGNGESEKNLGRVLQRLKPSNVTVGTKVRVPSSDFGGITDAVARSLEGSLARLRLDRVDIFHLHNAITETGGGEALSVRQVLGDVVPAFERLRQQGKTRFLGLTAVGDTAALHQVIDARAFESAQVVYNMLNPSAAVGLPRNYPAQDYGRLFDHTRAAGVGVVGIRVLAGGALSGSAARHPIASPPPGPIGSAMDYDADVAAARPPMALIE